MIKLRAKSLRTSMSSHTTSIVTHMQWSSQPAIPKKYIVLTLELIRAICLMKIRGVCSKWQFTLHVLWMLHGEGCYLQSGVVVFFNAWSLLWHLRTVNRKKSSLYQHDKSQMQNTKTRGILIIALKRYSWWHTHVPLDETGWLLPKCWDTHHVNKRSRRRRRAMIVSVCKIRGDLFWYKIAR